MNRTIYLSLVICVGMASLIPTGVGAVGSEHGGNSETRMRISDRFNGSEQFCIMEKGNLGQTKISAQEVFLGRTADGEDLIGELGRTKGLKGLWLKSAGGKKRVRMGDYSYPLLSPTTLSRAEDVARAEAPPRARRSPGIGAYRQANIEGLGTVTFDPVIPEIVGQSLDLQSTSGKRVPKGDRFLLKGESPDDITAITYQPLSASKYLFVRNDGFVGTTSVKNGRVGVPDTIQTMGYINSSFSKVELCGKALIASQGQNLGFSIHQVVEGRNGEERLESLLGPTKDFPANTQFQFLPDGKSLILAYASSDGQTVTIKKFRFSGRAGARASVELTSKRVKIPTKAQLGDLKEVNLVLSPDQSSFVVEVPVSKMEKPGLPGNLRYVFTNDQEGPGFTELDYSANDYSFLGFYTKNGETQMQWIDKSGELHNTKGRVPMRECLNYEPMSRNNLSDSRAQSRLTSAIRTLTEKGLCTDDSDGVSTYEDSNPKHKEFREELKEMKPSNLTDDKALKAMLYWQKPGAFHYEEDIRVLLSIMGSSFPSDFPELTARTLTGILVNDRKVYRGLVAHVKEMRNLSLDARLSDLEAPYQACVSKRERRKIKEGTVQFVKDMIQEKMNQGEVALPPTKISEWRHFIALGPILKDLSELEQHDLREPIEDSIELAVDRDFPELRALPNGLKNSFITNRINPYFGMPLLALQDFQYEKSTVQEGERERYVHLLVGNPIAKPDGGISMSTHGDVADYGMKLYKIKVKEGRSEIKWGQVARNYTAKLNWRSRQSGEGHRRDPSESSVNQFLNDPSNCAFFDPISNNIRQGLLQDRLRGASERRLLRNVVPASRSGDSILRACENLKNTRGFGGCSSLELVGHISVGAGAAGFLEISSSNNHTPSGGVFDRIMSCFKDIMKEDAPFIVTACGTSSSNQLKGLELISKKLGGRPAWAAAGYCSGDGWGAYCRRGWVGMKYREGRSEGNSLEIEVER